MALTYRSPSAGQQSAAYSRSDVIRWGHNMQEALSARPGLSKRHRQTARWDDLPTNSLQRTLSGTPTSALATLLYAWATAASTSSVGSSPCAARFRNSRILWSRRACSSLRWLFDSRNLSLSTVESRSGHLNSPRVARRPVRSFAQSDPTRSVSKRQERCLRRSRPRGQHFGQVLLRPVVPNPTDRRSAGEWTTTLWRGATT